jgi:hypothetical protein
LRGPSRPASGQLSGQSEHDLPGKTRQIGRSCYGLPSKMALHVLAYNLTRIMNIMGIQLLMASMRA